MNEPSRNPLQLSPADKRPWVGKLHHARTLCDDWGTIRNEAGRLVLSVAVPPSADITGWEQYRRDRTDPTQPIVDAILDALNRPNAEVSLGDGSATPRHE